MGHFHHNEDHARAYDQVNNASHEHKAKLSHEIIAAAASYEATKAYNEHCARHGKPSNHAKALELFAGFSGLAVDRLIETKGLDFVDRQKLKHDAKKYGGDHLQTQY
jgi:hypothetical protein